jgi:hypothetical protein
VRPAFVAAAVIAITLVAPSLSMAQPKNVQLSNDPGEGMPPPGYVSAYTIATGFPYTDPTLTECSKSRGRQNEPAVAVDPRNTAVILGSSNDYCAIYQPPESATPQAVGPIWLGYYRSVDSGVNFTSSLVPGYPQDGSPYAALAHIRTAGAGDPVIAWDNHGRAFFGAESSLDPAGTKKTFGDVWVATFDNPGGPDSANTLDDGRRFVGSEIVARGSSAPNLLGKFNDKTAIEADRTGGSCDGNVYFAYARFTGNGGVAIYFSRSTDHGKTWSSPKKLSSASEVQFPDISVTGNGHVYVTWRTFMLKKHDLDSIQIAKSTSCGASFAPPTTIGTFIPNDAVDIADPQPTPAQSRPDDRLGEAEKAVSASLARDCGDFDAHCKSGYTFFRRDTQARSTADQKDKARETIYLIYDATRPETEVATGTSYGTNGPGRSGVARTFFVQYNGVSGAKTEPVMLDNTPTKDGAPLGHQIFPDISVDNGYAFAIWWDSRNDPAYDVKRPIGNDALGRTRPSLDVYSKRWLTTTVPSLTTAAVRLTEVTTNPNYEQYANRAKPFAGDYLWVSNVAEFAYATWTDWRKTEAGVDQREGTTSPDLADVLQCRTRDTNGVWSADTCPRDGGLDQNIYGSRVP